MRDYVLDLQARIAHLPEQTADLLLETLAFIEGRLLTIHPFPDFNGRVTRVFLREVMRRLDIPFVRLAPATGLPTQRYLEALACADRSDWRPLMSVWRQRIEEQP
jgi:CRISPR-associated endonuclease/helicase Cas3